jgi:hypothetical protein
VNPPPKLSNRQELRVFGVVFGALAVVSAAAIVVGVQVGFPAARPPHLAGGIVFIGLFYAAPAAAPAALAGALLAIRMVNRAAAGRPLWSWAWRTTGAGALLGAAGAALWFTVLFAGIPEHLARVIGPVAAIGAGAGASVGLLTAGYCWHLRR